MHVENEEHGDDAKLRCYFFKILDRGNTAGNQATKFVSNLYI
jgi:hypothetical protein